MRNNLTKVLKRSAVLAVAVLMVLSSASFAFAGGTDIEPYDPGDYYTHGIVIVRFVESVTEEAEVYVIVDKYGLSVESLEFRTGHEDPYLEDMLPPDYPGQFVARCHIPEGMTEFETVDMITAAQDPRISSVEMEWFCLPDGEGGDGPVAYDPAENGILRLYGTDRFETAIVAAEQLKEKNGVSEFDTIIIASGDGYADALSSGYLASRKDAPILLINKKSLDKVCDYANANLTNDGKVYIIGGTGAVPKEVDEKIMAVHGETAIKRLAGSDRYDTNLEVLKEAGLVFNETEDMLVVCGTSFPDALSASAVGEPVLLVGQELTPEQMEYLSPFIPVENAASLYHLFFSIIGGTGAVPQKIQDQLTQYGSTRRISGDNRYETSLAVAEFFFQNNYDVDTVVIASGKDFPDALSGGPIAVAYNAPLILVEEKAYKHAKQYYDKEEASLLIVMGGDAVISQTIVEAIVA